MGNFTISVGHPLSVLGCRTGIHCPDGLLSQSPTAHCWGSSWCKVCIFLLSLLMIHFAAMGGGLSDR